MKYGTALLILAPLLSRGIRSLPEPIPLHEGLCRQYALRIGKERVRQWFSVRDELADRRRDTVGKWPRWWAIDRARALYCRKESEKAEEFARDSLTLAVEAFHWLRDITFDYPRQTTFELVADYADGQMVDGVVSLGEIFDEAHLFAHRAGELVGGIFGCLYVHDEHGWSEKCATQLMHIPRGNSPGMVVKYACSVCGDDPGECCHSLGEEYETLAKRIDGTCNICYEEGECNHVLGEPYRLIATVRVRDVVLQEVSLVKRPRDPLARITSRGVDNAELIRQFGKVPEATTQLWCHGCMYPCQGLDEVEVLEPTTPAV
ncbi:hypothetical protein HC031_14040 [Planosporangium thailandense]|uniref:Uncharacterized protein n=1 Tax=Planosporangium thailandense TaxID=765197 RepID=A0ABX0XXQ3_9ACTN|nr:hypothetical protein [Planosporangium thailandense]NJC70828.1 hypothetical protein [Planosporangium thailandense]